MTRSEKIQRVRESMGCALAIGLGWGSLMFAAWATVRFIRALFGG